MKQKRAMSEAAIEPRRERDKNRMNCFIQRKEAEILASGMYARNSTLEGVGYKVKEEEIITVSAKAAGNEAAAWALPNVLNCTIRYQSRSKLLLLPKSNSMTMGNTELKSVSVLLPS